MSPVKCLLINGSSRGRAGNTARLLDHVQSGDFEFEFRELILIEAPELAAIRPHLEWAEAFVFATGTYWDSWGWPLQRFLESATPTEGTSLWLGKPAAVLVTMHSVGGKSVLSRLQGVLNTFGLMLPPMTGVVISAIGELALRSADDEMLNDLWRPEDLNVVAANLYAAARNSDPTRYRSWDVDRDGFGKIWF